MIKSKRKARHFINYLYRNYNVPRIPIDIHWHYPSIVVTVTQECCFGLFTFNDESASRIVIACCKQGTTGVLSSLAHEFVHYLQYVHGRDMTDPQIEIDAEHYGAILFGLWLMREKDCSWVKAWEPKEDA